MQVIKSVRVILTLFVGCLFLTKCQDIDLLPKDDLTDENFWKSPSAFIKEVNKLYSTTESFENNIGKDVDSDIAFGLGENETSNGTWSIPPKDNDWDLAFVDLRQSNTIIERSKKYPGHFSDIERYVAEARFFRAYTHWRLLRKFNDVPIVIEVFNVESAQLYGARKTQTEVENFILSELNEINSKLPLQKELKSEDLGRITRGTVLALKARVALFAGTWAKYHQHRPDYQQLLDQAIIASDEVIKSNQYAIFEGEGAISYRQLFIDKGDDAAEEIFSSRYHLNIRTHSSASSVYWGNRGTPTRKLADMYLCKSTGLPITSPNSGFKGYATMQSEYENRDPRMTQTFLMPRAKFLCNENKDSLINSPNFTVRPESRTGYKLWKFIGEVRGGTNDAAYDYHIIRYAEVLLIHAEAMYEKTGTISDELLDKTINIIRSRKGVEMPPLTNSFVQNNALNMLTEIRRERTIELAFEGFRRDDLRRWKTAEVELKQAIRGIKYKNSEYETENVLNTGNPGLCDAEGFLIVENAEKRYFTTRKHYFYPLPFDQITLNPNLLPNNPGW